MTRLLTVAIISFAASAALMPAVIFVAKKLKVRQSILSYVDNHAGKAGTPTMGGAGFIAAAAATSLCFMRGSSSLGVMVAVLTLGFGLIGFLDDFIKVFFRQNKGLSPLQKVIFQLGVAAVFAVFAYRSPYVSDKLFLPFTMRSVSLGFAAIPLYAFVFLAFVNAVNLTDGLDGLAAKTSAAYTVSFAALIGISAFVTGAAGAEAEESGNLLVFAAALAGALIGFMPFNAFPAKIFMGDTGSLALGGALAGLAIMSRNLLVAPLIGAAFVLSCVSDIVQVAHFKRTGRRVFLMAPFHHHLERKGIHENRIVAIYTAATAFIGALTVLITLLVNT